MLDRKDRRKQLARALTIDHAVKLVRTHGTSYAAMYLKNHKFSVATIARVLSSNRAARRAVRTEDQNYTTVSRAARPDEGPARTLSYGSRSNPVHHGKSTIRKI